MARLSWNLRASTSWNPQSMFRSVYKVGFRSVTYMSLTLSDPTPELVRQYDFPVLLRCQKTSDTAFVAFVRPLSEPVRRFSSCSTEFSQQIAHVVLFLYLHVFICQNCRIITSNPPTSLPPKAMKPGKYALAEKLDRKGLNLGVFKVGFL
jgi:hypothetical protein